MNLFYLYFQITFGKFDCRICGKVYRSKWGLAKYHQKKHVEKSGRAREDYVKRQIVTNSKLLELVIKGTDKIQKQGYYPANLKDEVTVFSTTVKEKNKVHLHTDLPKIKVKKLDDFHATYYSLIVRFSGKYFPKLSNPHQS